MCLAVHKDSKIITARKDITVYKIVRISGDNYKSPYLRFEYEKNKKYSVSENLLKSTEGVCFDDLEYRIMMSYGFPRGDIRWIHKGFHFAFKESRLITPLNSCIGRMIVKCTIPKGSKYIRGLDDNLGVSDTIILH